MARQPQPLEMAVLKGATKTHPGRHKNAMPAPDIPIGKPPAYMSDDAVACWHEIVSKSPKGVLTGCDTFLLEQAANMMAEYRCLRTHNDIELYGPDSMDTTRINAMRTTFVALGFSPTARRELGAEPPKASGFKRLGQ